VRRPWSSVTIRETFATESLARLRVSRRNGSANGDELDVALGPQAGAAVEVLNRARKDASDRAASGRDLDTVYQK
jgi:hypothetical protein